MARPSTYLSWATSPPDPGDVSLPLIAIRQAGYALEDTPAYNEFNGILNYIDQWIQYLDSGTVASYATTAALIAASAGALVDDGLYLVETHGIYKFIESDTTTADGEIWLNPTNNTGRLQLLIPIGDGYQAYSNIINAELENRVSALEVAN